MAEILTSHLIKQLSDNLQQHGDKPVVIQLKDEEEEVVLWNDEGDIQIFNTAKYCIIGEWSDHGVGSLDGRVNEPRRPGHTEISDSILGLKPSVFDKLAKWSNENFDTPPINGRQLKTGIIATIIVILIIVSILIYFIPQNH